MLWSLAQTIDSSVHSFFDNENKVPVAMASSFVSKYAHDGCPYQAHSEPNAEWAGCCCGICAQLRNNIPAVAKSGHDSQSQHIHLQAAAGTSRQQFQTEQYDAQTALAKQVHGKVYEYQHGDMSECVTAVNLTEAIPVPVGEPVDERNLWKVLMDCNVWSSKSSYLTTLYIGDVVYGFVEGCWLRLPGSKSLPRCPWGEGRVHGCDCFVMRRSAWNLLPQLAYKHS